MIRRYFHKILIYLILAMLILSACATPQVQPSPTPLPPTTTPMPPTDTPPPSTPTTEVQKTPLSDNSNVVAQAQNELSSGQSELAVLLALEALENYIYTPQAENILAQAVQQVSPDTVPLVGSKGSARDAQWSPDGQWIAASGNEQAVRIWEWPGGELAHTLDELPAYGYYLAWSPDGNRLAIATINNAFSVWDSASWERLWELPGSPRDSVYVPAWSPDGARLAVAGAKLFDNYILVLDAETGQELTRIHSDRQGYLHLRNPSWAPQGDRLVAGTFGGPVSKSPAQVWDAASGELLLELPDQEGTTVMGAYSPDGRYIATVSGTGIVRVWDAESGQPVSPEVSLGGESIDLHWSPNGERLVTGATGKGVLVLDALTGAQVASYTPASGGAMVDWSPDGKYLLVTVYGEHPYVMPAWQTTEELIAYAKECCARRELTKEERAKFGLP